MLNKKIIKELKQKMKPCPKCGHKRKIWELSQYCPKCKTNLMFYGFEERFYEDAKKAEMSLANVRVKLEKVKTGLVGNKLAIVRLVCMLLPAAAMLLPFGKVEFTSDIFSKTLSLGIIDLFSALLDGTLGLLNKMSASPVYGETTAAVSAVMTGLLICAVAAVLVLLLTILCFISFKKMAAIICSASVVYLAAGIYTAVCFSHIQNVESLVKVQGGFGFYALCAAAVIVFAVNLIIARKSLPITYKPGDIERVEMRKRYLKKEIALADIPYPIFMTEEEREQREEAIAKTAAEIAELNAGGENNG